MLTVKQLAETVSCYTTIVCFGEFCFGESFTRSNIPSFLEDAEISSWWPSEYNQVNVILKSGNLENQKAKPNSSRIAGKLERFEAKPNKMPELENIRITFDSFVLDMDMRKGGGLL